MQDGFYAGVSGPLAVIDHPCPSGPQLPSELIAKAGNAIAHAHSASSAIKHGYQTFVLTDCCLFSTFFPMIMLCESVSLHHTDFCFVLHIVLHLVVLVVNAHIHTALFKH